MGNLSVSPRRNDLETRRLLELHVWSTPVLDWQRLNLSDNHSLKSLGNGNWRMTPPLYGELGWNRKWNQKFERILSVSPNFLLNLLASRNGSSQ